MSYTVTRNGQTYGPYTLEDLQRYVASGNILPSDMAKSDEMPDWLPVAQILGVASGTIGATPTAYAAPPAYPPASVIAYPDPPNLNWGLVLLFGILTCGLFSVIWDLVQALWVKRVQPQSNALTYFIIFVVLWFLNLGSSIARSALMLRGSVPHQSPLSVLIALAGLVLLIVFRFAMRASIEQHFNGPEPLGIILSGVMTFFFGGIYFQYKLNQINDMKQTLRYQNVIR